MRSCVVLHGYPHLALQTPRHISAFEHDILTACQLCTCTCAGGASAEVVVCQFQYGTEPATYKLVTMTQDDWLAGKHTQAGYTTSSASHDCEVCVAPSCLDKTRLCSTRLIPNPADGTCSCGVGRVLPWCNAKASPALYESKHSISSIRLIIVTQIFHGSIVMQRIEMQSIISESSCQRSTVHQRMCTYVFYPDIQR